MKDSTKKRLIIAGLVAVSVLLIFGISRVLYKEPVQELPKESKPTEEVELMVDTEETGQVQKETESTEETKELIIETETENGVESGKQEIQQTPEKTEDEKPEEPPALTEDADTTKPDTPPEYEEPEGTKPLVDDTPKTGDTKDGMIYIEGFGWVVDNGGGGSGTVADDMYENGNKVGIDNNGTLIINVFPTSYGIISIPPNLLLLYFVTLLLLRHLNQILKSSITKT